MDPQTPPTGTPLPHWRPVPIPTGPIPPGRTCELIPVRPAVHARDLFETVVRNAPPGLWTYLPSHPPVDEAEFHDFLEQRQSDPSSIGWVIARPNDGKVLGTASYLRIDPQNGVIEIGWLIFGPELQRTTPATEALFLLIDYAFGLGYRRVEWKCDSLNLPSCKAAVRLGFRHEGTFRQAVVVKQRNRDTAWYSILDSEWPDLREAFLRWLDPRNFEADGRQRQKLSTRLPSDSTAPSTA